jgi:tight adherence protein C
VIDLVIDRLHDPNFMIALLSTVAAMAAVLTIAMPYVTGDNLERRMKTVALERGKIRAREREKLARGDRVALRQSSRAVLQQVVDNLNLRKWLGEDKIRSTLIQAGYRGQGPYYIYLIARLVTPIVTFVIAIVYLFVLEGLKQPTMVKLGLTVGAAWLGMRLPELFLKNMISRRQLSIRRAFPDALDLLLICVESGMSVDTAFRKVSEEIGSQSVPLAEELTLATAELAYLQERRQAYDNLAARTNMDTVRSVCTALVQAERYGTPMGQALRVLAQENRDMRMSDAEKKAAGLPPKLTVPMILFFLPVLFVVILGPAAIRVMEVRGNR